MIFGHFFLRMRTLIQKQLPELTTVGKRQKLVFVKFFRLITPIILNTLLHTSKISKKKRGTITLYYATSIKKIRKAYLYLFLRCFLQYSKRMREGQASQSPYPLHEGHRGEVLHVDPLQW